MPRIARVVVPGVPHHITQRGVRRMNVFFSDADRRAYLDLLAEQGKRFGVHYLAWCLMPNHVHLVAIPGSELSLAKGIGEAHKRYSRRVNFRESWRGYLFQGPFFSCPLEDTQVLTAIRYVLRNPVRAGIAKKPWEYLWSSARWLVGELSGDPLAENSTLLQEIDDWRALLCDAPQELDELRRHTRTGRPLGSQEFLLRVEQSTGRALHLRKPGPKKKK